MGLSVSGANIVDALVSLAGRMTVLERQGTGRRTTGTQALAPIPAAKLFRSSAQPVPSGVITTVAWEAARWGTPGMWSVANPSRLVAPVAGIYQVSAHVSIAPNAGGQRNCIIVRSGSGLRVCEALYPSVSANDSARFAVSTDVRLAVGEHVELRVFQNSGIALNVDVFSGVLLPEFSLTFMSN